MAVAVRLEPLGDGPSIPLDRPIVLIGRHPDCDVRIDSHKISRRHCCVVQLHDKLMIRDLGSTNGIYCNGQRVEQAVLKPEDEVQIANLRYQVVTKEQSSGVAPAKSIDGERPPESSAGDAKSESPVPDASPPVDAAQQAAARND